MLATVGIRWQFFFLKPLFKKHGFWANKKYWLANKKDWQFFFFVERFFRLKSAKKIGFGQRERWHLSQPKKLAGQPNWLAVFFFLKN